MWFVAIGSVVGICLTVLGTIYVARRTNSGNVDNSPASELWTTLRSELVAVRARLAEVEGRLALTEAGFNSSRLEVVALQAEASRLRAEVAELQAHLSEERAAAKRAAVKRPPRRPPA